MIKKTGVCVLCDFANVNPGNETCVFKLILNCVQCCKFCENLMPQHPFHWGITELNGALPTKLS